MEYWDIYVLINERDSESLLNYATRFIPDFEPTKEVGEFALKVGLKTLFINSADEFITSACMHQNSEGGLRLKGNSNSNVNGGWIYFNEDGSVVFGLSVKETDSQAMLTSLKKECFTSFGYVAGDCPPADNKTEFIKNCSY